MLTISQSKEYKALHGIAWGGILPDGYDITKSPHGTRVEYYSTRRIRWLIFR